MHMEPGWIRATSCVMCTSTSPVCQSDLLRAGYSDYGSASSRLYFNFGIDVSPATPRHRPRQIVFVNIDWGIHPKYAPRRQHKVAHTWSSSPTTIYINKLHHVAAITDRGQRQTPTRSSPPTSDAAHLQAENPGLIPDMFYNYKSPSITTTSSLSTTTLPSESQSIFICTSVHKFSPCSPFVYSDTAEKFYTDRLRKIFFASQSGSGSHGSSWSLSSHVRCWQHRCVPSSPTRSRVWETRHCGSSYFDYRLVYLKYYYYYCKHSGEISSDQRHHRPRLQRPHSRLHRPRPQGLPPHRRLCSSQTVRFTADPTAGRC
jgi:hypothetical protein